MASFRRLLLGLMLMLFGALAAPAPSIEPHSPIDIVVDTLAPQAQAVTSSQRALLRRGISPVASWDASTGTLTSLAALVTATRTSNAMMFDSTGKLTYAPNNLLTYSNTFSNAAWTKLNLTVSSGVTDPFGGSAAFTITATAANGQIFQDINSRFISSAKTVQTIWIKRRTGSGTVNYYDPAGNNTHALSLTGSWQQFTYASSGTANWSFAGNILLVTSGDAIDIYAATASAVTYETTPRTADQVITTSAAYYGPRIDYTYSSTPGLLVEGARTNYLPDSTGLGASAFNVLNNVTRSVGGGGVPSSGAGNYTRFTASPGTLSAYTQSVGQNFTSGSSYTISLEVSYVTHRWVGIALFEGGFLNGTTFDLQNGANGSNHGVMSGYSITPIGGGKYRISAMRTAASTVTAYWSIVMLDSDKPFTTTTTSTLSATSFDATFGQMEVGSNATSYIPTAASSVTRAADVLAAAAYSSNPAIIQYRSQSTGTRARKKLTTFSSISSETAEWIEAIRVYPVGTSSAYLDAHLTVDGAW